MTSTHDDSTPLRQARAGYFRDNGFGEAGHKDRWVRIKLGPAAVWLPNLPARQRAVPLHDLHHIATGYDTSFLGEAEIAAWELGSGCKNYIAAWLLNIGAVAGGALLIGAVAGGALLAPRRIGRAFRRGRRSSNLYQLGFNERWLSGTVGQLRQRLTLE